MRRLCLIVAIGATAMGCSRGDTWPDKTIVGKSPVQWTQMPGVEVQVDANGNPIGPTVVATDLDPVFGGYAYKDTDGNMIAVEAPSGSAPTIVTEGGMVMAKFPDAAPAASKRQ